MAIGDDLTGPATNPGARTAGMGYYEDPLAKYNGGVSSYGHGEQIYDPQSWGGESYMTDANGKFVDGTTGAQKDAAYYRNQGQQTSTAVQLDPRATGMSDAQIGSLSALQGAAQGNAPSQAVAQGNIAQSDAMRAQMMGAMGAQGGMGAQLGAMRGAMNMGGMQMGSLAAGTMNGRAGEMGQSMGQYAGAAGTMRGQADQAGIAQAQLDAQQRALQQQRQEAYEKMGWDTTNAQMTAANEAKTNAARQALADRQSHEAERQQTVQQAEDYGKLALGAGMGLSDARAKEDIHAMGSLACLMRK